MAPIRSLGGQPGLSPARAQVDVPLSAVPEAPAEQTVVVNGLDSNEPGPSNRPCRSSGDDFPVVSPGVGTESVQRQEQQPLLATTSVLDGHPSGELLTGRRAGGFGNPEFMTPRSNTSIPTAQNNWLGGLEVPRWVTRLGSYLSVGHAELAPSPLLGSPSTPTPPQGGQAFRLRSPSRTTRYLPPPPTPPSSSDIPQEAIQAEVQRQLGNLLTRLQSAEEQNHRLRAELDETQRTLEETRRDVVDSQQRPGPAMGTVGDIQDTQVEAVQSQSTPRVTSTTLTGQRLFQAQGLFMGPSVPQGFGVPGRANVLHEDGLPGGDRHSGRAGEFPNMGASEPPGATTASIPPMAPAPPPVPEQRGFLRSFLGTGRSRGDTPPPPKTPAAAAQESPMMDALMKGVQQLQELQAAAMAKGQSLAAEVVKPGTTSLTSLPAVSKGAETALLFQDWLEVTSSVMRDVSEQSGVWWEAVLQEVERAYKVWLAATPLERLNVFPEGKELSEGRWTRLNARVASMLLSAMTVEQRGDMVAHRISTNVVKMLYRLHTVYQPGGSHERQDVLRRLQGPLDYQTEDSLEGALGVLRNWPRWMSRCTTVGMSPPDASVLARGLKLLTSKWIDSSPDAAFRTSMLRTSLRLDGQPTMESVFAYQKHLQAEIETLVSSQPRSSVATSKDLPHVRALEGNQPTSASPKGKDKSKGQGSGELCRYFMKATGCKRGLKCGYSHDMSSLDRAVRNKKCLACGSEGHRQRECTVGKPSPKATSTSSGGQTRETPAAKDREKLPGVSSVSTTATTGASDTLSSSTSSAVQGIPWTLETLIQAAQQVVQPVQAESAGESSPEKTTANLKTLRLRDIRVCTTRSTTTALVDSGATHSLRTARSEAEWNDASEVLVQLAGSYSLVMKITEAGTLLMPYKGEKLKDSERGAQAQTIVPMGQLIQTLGYTMVWSKDQCYLESQNGERIPLQVAGGCPQLQEMEALSLIARLEDRKMEELNNAVLTTEDKLKMSALVVERTWEYYLMDYIVTGSFESGLRAVRDAPFFADLPGECLHELIPTRGLWAGWDIMKEIGFLNRPQKRKLLMSKRWVVHLFAGKEGHWELMKLGQGDCTVIELDLARCKGQDVLRDETWRMLLWGAKEGKIDVILGGPPARSQQKGSGGERDVKSVALIARMLWLHAVAQVGREVNGTPRSKNRDVGFVLEYPEGPSRDTLAAQEALIRAREEEVQEPGSRGGVASWNHAQWYWEYVQRPRFELYAGKPTMDGRVSFWNTRLWKTYQRESGLRTVSFDQGAMGSATKNRTTIATNVNNLMGLDELRLPADDERPETGPDDSVWAPGLVNALVVSLSFWDREPHAAPRMRAMTPEQWKQHVDSNHEVYRKECATCVMARGTGRQHRRIHHPDSYVLTADVAGPLAKGLDPTSKGTMGKNLKYLLVAKYIVPKAYIQLHSGAVPPDGDGGERELSMDDVGQSGEQDQLLKDLFGDEEPTGAEDVSKPVEVIQVPGEELSFQDDAMLEALDYEPSVQEEDGEDPMDDEGDLGQGQRDQVMSNGDCEPPDHTYLMFAVGLENNQASTVRRALQDMVLYLEMHSFPIYRFHADKGEFFNHQLRSWLRDHSIYATWSEPGIPQGNGHAEGAVRWTKDRIRTLLQGASLPTRLWPVAAATAAAQQRARVLAWRSHLAAPFGATVHLKRKAFDEKGPQRREHALESKWTRGKYVGLSTILHHGHIVYVPAEGEEREKFFHTVHVRPNLIDPGEPEAELVAEPPKPKRRLAEKSRLEDIEMRALDAAEDEVKLWATTEAKNILENWSLDKAKMLINKLAKATFFGDRKFGLYRHGGSVGWMKGIKEFPDLVQLLTKFVTEVEPSATFTSVLVSYNTQKSLHKDFNNDPRTYNYVIPTQAPLSGGELWVELKPGDYVKGPIEQRFKGDKMMYGQCLPLDEDKAIKIGPMSAHEVCAWEGDRIVVIGYSPQCLGKLNQDDVALLHEYGFPIPLSQLPEYYANEDAEAIQLRAIELLSEEEIDDVTVEPDWTMYLDLNPGMARITDSTCGPRELPQARKAEVVYTPDIENVLAKLSGPLDVTYTVNPAEVMNCLERWKPAIEKELRSIEVAIERLSPGSEERRRWLNRPGVQRLPTKFVFTIKPNDQAIESDPATWYKRKARLVVCGNMAAEDGAAVYTETAPAEAVRAGLTLATRYRWTIAVLDVVAAFLRTPMNRSVRDPIVVVQPPRLLEVLGLAIPTELWGLVRALYGLRQSPALWGDFRDYTLRTSTPPAGMRLQQGGAATSWWRVVDECDHMIAIILIYVDDFLLCGPSDVVTRIAEWIRGIWETSTPTFLAPGTSIRFLGMELHVDEQFPGEVGIGQQGYIQELLRLHGLPSTAMDKIPISKELVSEREVQEGNKPEEIHMAQQLTGEILWLAQRSRPDISFASSIMASLCLKQPRQVIEIGMKTLGYLQRTTKYQLRIRWEENSLVMFCDAAYAPQSARSHGGWLVMYGGSPIMWRSGRQSMITLSTAEAELLAIIDGAIAMKGVEALLMDMGLQVEEKQIASDSTAALSISTGSSSWRTRHLKIKANWLQEQVSHGQFTTVHCPGERQPADLLTKALSSARIASLLQLWRVGEPNMVQTTSTSSARVSSRALVAVICCLLMVSVRASDGSPVRHQGVQLDWDLAGIMMVLLMVLGALMIWEAVRWVLIEFYNEWTPGASGRKLRRLRKLQAATTSAIEKELERLQREQQDNWSGEPGGVNRQSSSMSSSSTQVRRDSPRPTQREPMVPTVREDEYLSRPRTPTSSRRRMTLPSPTISSPGEDNDSVEEINRVCIDVCGLMTVECLKEGLRTEGCQVTGVKDDLKRRLGNRLGQLLMGPSGPTTRQMRYILWLYRHRDLEWKHTLRYCEIVDRVRVSALIHTLKNL